MSEGARGPNGYAAARRRVKIASPYGTFGEGQPVSEQNPLPEIDAATAKAWLDARDALLIDVREPPEYAFESVAGSLLLPLSRLDAKSFPPLSGRKIILMCAAGRRSATAQAMLAKAGFSDLYNLAGGMNAWKLAGYDVVTGTYEDLDFSI